MTTRSYSVTVDRHTLDTYVVSARNSTEAGVLTAQAIAEGWPPKYSSEKSRRILMAKPIIEEEVTQPELPIEGALIEVAGGIKPAKKR